MPFSHRLRTAGWAIFLILVSSCFAQQLPKGWHAPPAKLTNQDFREHDPHRFLSATGDFNGDGLRDKAMLLVDADSTKMALFVCLKTTTGCDWHRLEEMDVAFLDVMGIDTVKPGKQNTACGKGYWECKKGEPQILNLKHEAVEFFEDESASSVYVYNVKKRKFTPIATSD
jgi:hypothetical protein